MYIDKIYTKLYSNKDWNGLDQLVNEIKSFARKDYEGLGLVGRGVQRLLRGIDAFRVKNERNKRFKKSAQSILDKAKDNSDTRLKQMNVLRSTQLRRDKEFIDKLKNERGINLNKVLSPLSKVKSATKELLGIPEGFKSPRAIIDDYVDMSLLKNKKYDQPVRELNNNINEFLMDRVKEDGRNKIDEVTNKVKTGINEFPDKLKDKINKLSNLNKGDWDRFISRFKK